MSPRSKLFAYGTIVVLGGLRVKASLFVDLAKINTLIADTPMLRPHVRTIPKKAKILKSSHNRHFRLKIQIFHQYLILLKDWSTSASQTLSYNQSRYPDCLCDCRYLAKRSTHSLHLPLLLRHYYPLFYKINIALNV